MTLGPDRVVHAALFDLWGTLIHDVPERGILRRKARFQGIARVFTDLGMSVTEEDIAQAMTAVASSSKGRRAISWRRSRR